MFKRILKTKWMWLIYQVLFVGFLIHRACAIFCADQPQFLYYHILLSMSTILERFPWAYLLALLALLMNGLTFILLWFYVCERRIFSIAFITLFLAVKLISDTWGYSYEWNTVRSLFSQSTRDGWLALADHVLWRLPPYFAFLAYIGEKIKHRTLPMPPMESAAS